MGILNKSGIATQRVARALCGIGVGDRIPTVDELVKSCDCVRGNVQKALMNLKKVNAVELETHGQNGTILISIDYIAIAQACGVDHLVGVMPLPYTGRYEGLATGLYTLMEESPVRSYISFMRGSEARVQSMTDGFADYCVMSGLAYQEYRKRGCPISPVLKCDPNTYVGRHVLLTREGRRKSDKIKKVGIDTTSADQFLLTKRFFEDREVEFVPIQYTEIVRALKTGRIDAGIWNEDDLHLNEEGLHSEELNLGERFIDDTRAMVVARQGDCLTNNLLKKLIDPALLLEIQMQVMKGDRPACY